VALETPRPRRFLAIAGLGVVAMLLAGPPALAVAPWRCAPQRLGAAIPLAPLALGVYGLHQAARPPEMAPAVLGRVGPLGAGIVVAWLGTYHPPPPPLYNLPAGIAMWGLSAAGLGVALRLVRHGAPPPLRMALALGIGAGLVAGLSPTPGSDAASCASWLASPTVLWLLATGLIRLAGPTAELSGARLVDGLLLLQVVWQAGFVPR